MKNLLLLVIAGLLITSCAGPENKFRLSGKVDDALPGWIVLSKVVNNEIVAVDSVNSKNGEFDFSAEIGLPELYYLRFNENEISHRIFIESANIKVAGSIEDPLISGSSSHNIYQNFVQGIKNREEQREKLYEDFSAAMSAGNQEQLEIIRSKADEIDEGQETFINDFIFANKDNVVGALVVVNNIYYYSLEQLIEKRGFFDETIADSKYIQMLENRIAKLQNVAIGQVAPLFSQNDTDGNPVDLIDLRGKYLLIDFWASWCGPCRKENPNIVAAWQKYHDKGFDILGVSLDRDRANWLQGIAEDNLTWTHVSDLKFWNNEASNLYAVSSIPASFLLDPDGVIVAKNLKGDDLHLKLQEIFGN